MARPIYEIAREIKNNWPKVNYAAKPYLDAMFSLENPTDKYYMDNAQDIIARFLCNASAWRGDVAKRVKLELKGMYK